LNVQTEHLDNQTAKFTVEIDPVRLDKAKKAAAKKLAKRVNIPGFRKGKAPYRILVQNGLEPQILNDAIDNLSQEIYRETLEQSDIEPYGPGSFEDFELEPPTFIYTVPLQPAVELNDYADVRVDFELPEVSDEDVDDALRRLQEQEALVEESEEPLAIGNRVTADIHSEFVDDPAEVDDGDDSDADADAEADEGEDETHIPMAGDGFIHEHDAVFRLDPENEPILPGFNEAMVGAEVDSDLEFELTVPDDHEEYEDIQGRKIKFQIHVKKIESMTLPDINDEFAARISEEEEDEPLTLLELRDKIRESIEQQLSEQASQEYANKVLTEMVERAEVSYPPAMLEDQIDSMLEDLDQRLRQQGMNLDNYMQITGNSRDDLREQYRESAATVLSRSLVLSEIVKQTELQVTEAQVQSRIDDMVAQFGAQAAQLRSMFDTPQMRSAMVNDIVQDSAFELIRRIGKGEGVEDYLAELEAEQTAYEEAQAAAIAEAEAAAEAEEAEEEPVVVDAEFKDVESADDAEVTEAEEAEEEPVVVDAEFKDVESADDAEATEAEEVEEEPVAEVEADDTDADDDEAAAEDDTEAEQSAEVEADDTDTDDESKSTD